MAKNCFFLEYICVNGLIIQPIERFKHSICITRAKKSDLLEEQYVLFGICFTDTVMV